MEEYEYVSTLGEGAYGHVWKCRQQSSGRIVAVKGFKEAHTQPEIKRLALREVRMLQGLDHPAIVPLLEAFRSRSGRVYLVFPFIGRSAFQALDDHPDGLPPKQLKLLVWQMLHALLYLHHNKVVHRDIKPANILVSDTGNVVLCDLGFARQTQCAPHEAAAMSPYVVTRWYRPPEVLLGQEYGPAADIWSLGCTIAELVTGVPLFQGSSTVDQLWRIMRCFGGLTPSQWATLAANPDLDALHGAPLGGRTLRERLPARCDPFLLELLDGCLRLDPRNRSTAAELLDLPYFWSVPYQVKGTALEATYEKLAVSEPRAARVAAIKAAALAAPLPPPAAEAAPPPAARQSAGPEPPPQQQQEQQQQPQREPVHTSEGRQSGVSANKSQPDPAIGSSTRGGASVLPSDVPAAATTANVTKGPSAAPTSTDAAVTRLQSAAPQPTPALIGSDTLPSAGIAPRRGSAYEPNASDTGTELCPNTPGVNSAVTRHSTCSTAQASPPAVVSLPSCEAGRTRTAGPQSHSGGSSVPVPLSEVACAEAGGGPRQQSSQTAVCEASAARCQVSEGQEGAPGSAGSAAARGLPDAEAPTGPSGGAGEQSAPDAPERLAPPPRGSVQDILSAAGRCLPLPQVVPSEALRDGTTMPGAAGQPDGRSLARDSTPQNKAASGGTPPDAQAAHGAGGRGRALPSVTSSRAEPRVSPEPPAAPANPAPGASYSPTETGYVRDALMDSALARALVSCGGASDAPSHACAFHMNYCDTWTFDSHTDTHSAGLAKLRAGPPAPTAGRGCAEACPDFGTLPSGSCAATHSKSGFSASIFRVTSALYDGSAAVGGEPGMQQHSKVAAVMCLPPRRAHTSSSVGRGMAAGVAGAASGTQGGFGFTFQAGPDGLMWRNGDGSRTDHHHHQPPLAQQGGRDRERMSGQRPTGDRDARLGRWAVQRQVAAVQGQLMRRATSYASLALAGHIGSGGGAAAVFSGAPGANMGPAAELAQRLGSCDTGMLTNVGSLILGTWPEVKPPAAACDDPDAAPCAAVAISATALPPVVQHIAPADARDAAARVAATVYLRAHSGSSGAISPAVRRKPSRFSGAHLAQPAEGSAAPAGPPALGLAAAGEVPSARARSASRGLCTDAGAAGIAACSKQLAGPCAQEPASATPPPLQAAGQRPSSAGAAPFTNRGIEAVASVRPPTARVCIERGVVDSMRASRGPAMADPAAPKERKKTIAKKLLGMIKKAFAGTSK